MSKKNQKPKISMSKQIKDLKFRCQKKIKNLKFRCQKKTISNGFFFVLQGYRRGGTEDDGDGKLGPHGSRLCRF